MFNNNSTKSSPSSPFAIGAQRNLWGLIAIIFFSSVATMMVLSALPAFMLMTLKLTPSQIGCIEGAGIVTAYWSKFAAGLWSDHQRRRKGAVVLGTALSVLTKGCFAIATGYASLLCVMVGDRVAKGFRSCPVDAMIGDLTARQASRLYYSLKQAAMLLGNIVGSLITRALLLKLNVSFQVVFACAVFPCFLAFFLAKQGLVEPEQTPSPPQPRTPLWVVRGFSKEYWGLLLVCFLLMFSRFGTSFAGQRAHALGMKPTDWPMMLILYDCFAVGTALCCGLWKKTGVSRRIFQGALICFMGAHTLFALAPSTAWLIPAVMLSGCHLGAAQGVLLSLVSRSVNQETRATAFAFYYLVAGLGGFLGNRLAGFLCTLRNSSDGAFFGGVFFSLLTLVVFTVLTKSKSGTDPSQC